ncbi:MAG TPA: hypothetical protein DD706_06090, partial [Nitrospiraceae bacterium]|nr:hypothetical protein [Nitrospiraceae bacterium]
REKFRHQQLTGMFKNVIQQGHSHFGARSVPSVREHDKKMARTPLVAFFNIPIMFLRVCVSTCPLSRTSPGQKQFNV